MSTSINQFFIQRQFADLEKTVAGGIRTDAEKSLEHFRAINSRLQAQRDQLRVAKAASDRDSLASIDSGVHGNAEGWLAPAPRIARAYGLWRNEACFKDLVIDFPQRLRLAMVVGGGVGDHIKASAVIPRLLRMIDADIYYIADNKLAAAIFHDNPYLRKVLVARENPHELVEECLIHLPVFDLVASWRYAIEYFVPAPSRLPADLAAAFKEISDERAAEFRKYYFCNEIWPKYNNSFGRAMTRRGMNALDIGAFTASREHAAEHLAAFFPDPRSLGVAEALGTAPYITVHHGFDLNHLPQKSTKTQYGSTKNIPLSLWREVCELLRSAGIDVVQLGATGEEEIPGVTRNLSGLTTFSETAMIVKRAICHIDTEGGLVHLARAVHTRSVVLFGPTPVGVFGYRQNINIEPRTCKACWYVAPNWVVQCPRLTEGPHCMTHHRANDVVSAVNEMLTDARSVAGEVAAILDLGADDIARLLFDPALRGVAESAADGLFVGERIDDASLKALGARERSGVRIAVATDVPGHEIDAAAAPAVALRIELCSMFNLPMESGSADFVICRSAVWAGEYRHHAMREMFRVLKPDGVLVAWPEPGGGAARFDIAAILADAGFASIIGVDVDCGLADAFIIRKRVSAESKWPPIYCPAPNELEASAQVVDAPEDYRRELEGKFRINEELIFDTYRYYVQRNQVNDAIWSNKDAILQLSLDQGGWISLSSNFFDGYPSLFTLRGWHAPETWGVWGAGRTHMLVLPLTEGDLGARDVLLEVQIELPLMALTPERTVRVSVGGERLELWVCRMSEETRSVRIPASRAALGVMEVEFHVEVSVVPSSVLADNEDTREVGMGLQKFRYRYVSDEAGRL